MRSDLELDERKGRILWAVVDDYIASAEPVGSRTLARKYDLGVSPATIRNEMADLEMLGYLEHLHTSSGRIPSSLGYRFYVNGLLPIAPVTDREKRSISEWYRHRVRRLDEVFSETAKLIAELTHNVSLVLAPQAAQAIFRFLQFLPLDKYRVVAVLMTDAGFMENKIVNMPSGASFEDFQRIAAVINKNLIGKALPEISASDIKKIRHEINDEELFQTAIGLIRRALETGTNERLYLGGTTQLLDYPEFSNIERIRDILLVLEQEELVKDILHAHLGDGLAVTIGKEHKKVEFQDSSLITATYHLDGELLGSIAILGPTRMEYSKAMSLLDYINTNLTEVIHRLEYN